MALTFMTDEQRQQMIDDKVAFCWAPFADAVGGRTLNGYPFFASCGTWTQDEGERILAKLREIEQTMEGL
jgi:hypothetical protein